MSELARGSKAAEQRASEILNRIRKIKNPVVIEVGVNRAVLSRVLLSKRPDLTLYMVDNWLGEDKQPDHYKATHDRNAHRSQKEANQAYQIASDICYKYKERCHICKGDSVEIASYFDDKCADLIFLDADHSYEGVKRDIEAYVPKSRMWIGGHDYKSQQPQFDFSGVDRAVEEAFGEVETGLNLTWFKHLYAS